MFEHSSDLGNGTAVLWTWALILVICAPYLVTFLKNLWKSIAFYKGRWCGVKVFVIVSSQYCVYSTIAYRRKVILYLASFAN